MLKFRRQAGLFYYNDRVVYHSQINVKLRNLIFNYLDENFIEKMTVFSRNSIAKIEKIG